MGWGAIQQFILVDAETGDLITTYCADRSTYAQDGFSYNIENVEDAEYYTEEQAAMIRTVPQNGYWGTETGVGSLDSMREMMRNAQDAEGNAVFTEEGSGIIDSKIAKPTVQTVGFLYVTGVQNCKRVLLLTSKGPHGKLKPSIS